MRPVALTRGRAQLRMSPVFNCPSFVKIEKKNGESKPRGLFFAALLAVVLAALFWKSFLPGYVHFSNDGPLGQQNAAWRQLPAAFTGSWYDINDLGVSAGAMALAPSTFLFWALGPVGYAKFLAPLALFILGLGAWAFFRALKLSPLAATLGALAATLNSAFFATACWGVAPQQIAIGMDFFALALVVSNTAESRALVRCARLALAGLAVGINVMEAADIGAIFSLFVAAFVLFKAIADEGGAVWAKTGRGIGRVAIIALFAGFIAAQSIVALVGAAIVGIAGTSQDVGTKAQHWDAATQWSLPKLETLSLFMPGVFGYKMDTPHNMPDFLQDAYQGGEYWGGMGRDPVLDRFFDSGGQGQPPPYSYMRQTGGQNYAGVLVALLAFWAMAQSLRRENSAFPEVQRRFIWFWSVVLIGSLLLAYGRFAPFYKLFYMLPYVSTIRNPAKFLYVFSWAIAILFAYGVHGLSRRYLEMPAANSSLSAKIKNWWAKVRGFDRNWTYTCVGALFVAVLGWLIYGSEKPGLVRYLQTVGFGEEDTAKQIAAFSVGQVRWFVLLFALAAGLCVLVIAGVFAGRRARLGSILLGVLLVVDLGRADLPYIIHWDYKQKNDIDPANSANSTNPIVNFLRHKSYEHRVVGLPFNAPQHLPFYDDWFGDLYRIEWAQHHFPYYNIQSLDKIQMPRMPADLLAYEMALTPRSAGTAYLLARRWELTNTRYLLGPAGFLDLLNEQLDPTQRRFRIVQRFDIVAKPGIERLTQLEQMTAALGENGACALFEFTGALPRVKLYSRWQVDTNAQTTLQMLTNADFDPQQTVLVSTPLPIASSTNQNSGTVEVMRYVPTDPAFKGKKNDLWAKSGYCYAPNDIMFNTQAPAPSVLLLNDMYDPHWRVFVDDKPAELLRCNFIMRGVYLTPGAHKVEFKFTLPSKPLYITLAAIGVGMLLCGYLMVATRRRVGPGT